MKIYFSDYLTGTTLSGRAAGCKCAKDSEVLTHILTKEKIILVIDDSISAINTSFIIGFFKEIFFFFKTKEKVNELIELETSVYYKRLIFKNWIVLESIVS